MESVTAKTIWCYGLPALPLAMIGLVYFAYIPTYYSDQFTDSLIGFGLVILLTRVFDGVLDPLVGWLSDRGVCSFGQYRRKQFLPLGALLLSIGTLALMVPQYTSAGLAPDVAFAWWSCILFLGWSLYAVPYEALGTELSFDYERRSGIFAVRDGAIASGTLLAVVLVESLKAAGFTMQATFFIFAIIACALLCVATLGLALSVPEKLGSRVTPAAGGSFFAPLASRPFRTLLVAYTLSGFGAALPATLLLFFARYVLGEDIGGYYLGLYLLCGVLGFPLWQLLCKRLEKKKAWMIATVVNSGAFLFTLLLGQGDLYWFAAVVIVSGLGYAGTQMYPSSMQADVIDLEERRTGSRQEGAFVGLWSVSRKCAAALGAGVALPLLALVGFDPAAAQQTPEAISALSFLYAGVPALCALGSLVAIASYPISRSEHEQVSLASAERWQSAVILERTT